MRLGSPLPHKKARIEIIPLIDIMFFLLASFMMASLNMIHLQAARVSLPAAKTAKQDFQPDLVNIGVGKDGEVFLEGTQSTLVDLHNYLSNRLRINTNVPVYITGDKDALHGAVKRVLLEVYASGIQQVSFAISPETSNPK
jgi:biopolymer transport protein ExbD